MFPKLQRREHVKMSAESIAQELAFTCISDSLSASATDTTVAMQTMILSSSTTTLTDTATLVGSRPAAYRLFDSKTMAANRTLTVRNYSTRPQSFIILASSLAFAPLSVPDVVRYCVYQASMLVAAETGSHTFLLPVLGGQPGADGTVSKSGPVYAVTGCARQKPEAGVTLFVSDVHTLQEGDGVGPGERCIMTMPEGYEAAFSKGEMPKDLDDDDDPVANSKGNIGIETDNTFDSTHPGYPFVGLGAPNPYNVREVVPLISWDAVPGNAYLIRPDLQTWIVARDSAEKGSIYELSQSTRTQTVSFAAGEIAAEVILEKNGTFTLIKGIS